jgi:hypothetical protein
MPDHALDHAAGDAVCGSVGDWLAGGSLGFEIRHGPHRRLDHHGGALGAEEVGQDRVHRCLEVALVGGRGHGVSIV